jgi:HD-GYP domain-containing protein (c-di-GMP phosphodiesterase class II)
VQVLVISKSAESTGRLVEALRASGCEVHVAPKTDDIVRIVRRIPLSAIFVQAAPGAEAERFRETMRKLHPKCKVILIGRAPEARGGSHEAGAWVLADADLAELLRSARSAKPEEGDDRRVRSLVQSLETVVSLLESEDPYFVGSTHRVTRIAEEIGRRMNLSSDTIDEIVIASLLRDIGKVGLQAALVESNERFGDDQAARMRDHVMWSERLLAHIDFPWRVQALVRHHHERYDGSGYPDGLAARQIPVGARILAAADCFVAMVSDRRHRSGKSLDKAREELMLVAGTQLDPEVVEHLLAVLADRVDRGADGAKPTVVVVDLDASYRRLLRLRLMDEGVEVVLRGSLRDLETLLEGKPPDLIAADLGADGIRGLEWLREKMQASGLRVPVAILGAEGDRMLRMQCLKHGIEDFLGKDSDLEETVARIKNILLRKPDRLGPIQGAPLSGLRGRLESMALPDVIQFLVMGAKTARVTINANGGDGGEIWFLQGAITHATFRERMGAEAVFELLLVDEGDFRIEHGITTEVRTVEGDPTHLVLEGLRRRDESQAGKEASQT